MLTLAGRVGNKFLSILHDTSKVIDLLYLSLGDFFISIRRWHGNRLIFQVLQKQVLFTGVDALPIISIISLLLGAIVITQSTTQLPMIGGENFIGNVIVLVIIRELGPLVTAMVVIARSGSAIATELGIMSINKEIEALEAMGISITRFLIFPRIIGFLIAILCLSVYFDIMAILGGFIISKIQLVTPFDVYIYRISLALSPSDVGISLMKCAVFGVIIAILSSYHGLRVKYCSTEVPQATTRAIVSSIVVCFLFNSAVTIIFYI